ncbi:MAG: hypothetical protein FWH23_07175 [Bacteroidales bacterium]|nr:hypothetical protein [Bacteroidales bacterium]MCL2133757.1 hypothetical protein [Bacteroidales bacterium]
MSVKFHFLITLLLTGLCSCLCFSVTATANADDVSTAKALSVFAALDASGRYGDDIHADNLITLPFGVNVPVGAFPGTIAVSNTTYYEDYVELTVFARLALPFHTPDTIYFGAQSIKLSYNGGFLGDATLLLLRDIPIPLFNGNAELILKGNFSTETGTGQELTYVKISCNDFKEVSIAADIAFPEALMIPINMLGEHIVGQRVKGHFNTVIESWNDIVATVSLPPFELRGLDGFIFELQNTVFDFSEKRNADMTFPPYYDYNAAGVFDGRMETWQGFFVKNLKVSLPTQFSGKDKPRISIEAHNMLIDATGVSGDFAGYHLLSFDQGNAGGWAFSLDRFELTLLSNVLTGVAFNGEIGLPLSSESRFGYTGLIDADNNYLLRANSLDTINVNMFFAEALLEKNSYIQLAVIDGEFRPAAMLHGKLNISSPAGINADFKGIEFRSLHLQTVSPYISVDYLGYGGELKLMNFPLSANNIGLTCNNDRVALSFGLQLTLSDGAFSGATGMTISGKLTRNEDERTNWEFEKIEISEVTIDATIAEAITLKGSLKIMNNEPTYGNGFDGSIKLNIKKPFSMTVDVRAIFGYSTFRYWAVDANLDLPAGVFMPPCFLFTGFGGGVSFRMKPEQTGSSNMPTGLKYIPDNTKGIGLTASTKFTANGSSAIQGTAMFQILFNASGGLNFIGFFGTIDIMAKANLPGNMAAQYKSFLQNQQAYTQGNQAKEAELEKAKTENPNMAAAVVNKGNTSEVPMSSSAVITADAGIMFDFEAQSLHACFNMYLDVAGGFIHGSGPNKRAGWAELHIDPDDWYLYLGVPDDPVGVTLSLGPINVSTSSYFMLGTQILNSPPPPQQVADILGVALSDIDYMSSLNALGAGRGIAFGARLNVSTGDLRFLMFYAKFEAGLGFDIMVKEYENAYCEGSNAPIGMNGWFANGQAYAYLQGELGILVKMWFFSARIPIISAGAAALLQAKLPNPSWFRGMLGVRYNVLGGLIKGSCNFKFTIGKECVIVSPGSPPVDMEMIADISPNRGSQDVDVFSNPQVTFNMAVNKVFQVTDDDGVNKSYRIKINELAIKDGNQVIDAVIKFNGERNIADLVTHEVLPPNKPLTVKVRVGFEERVNGQWVICKTGGVEAQEIKETAFTTGDAPNYIPVQNIVHTYPIVDQQYFLKNEASQGYVQLDKGQSYLFANDFVYRVRATADNGATAEQPLTYHSLTKRLNYVIPYTQNDRAYTLNFVSASVEMAATVEKDDKVTTINNEEEETEIIITEKQAADVIGDIEEILLLEYDFATSRYNTLAEKLSGVTAPGLWWSLGNDVIHLIRKGQIGEAFDLTELEGNNFTENKPLLAVKATLDDNYFTQKIGPLIYHNYPVGGIFYFTNRNTAELGIVPTKAVFIIPAYITDGIFNNNQSVLQQYFPFYYGLRQAYKNDYHNIATQIVNRYVETTIPIALQPIAWYGCPYFEEGTYNTAITYTLPDGTQTSTVPFWYQHTF